jgi:hypothetical protein
MQRMQRMQCIRRSAGLLVGAAIAGLLLTACGEAQPGVAASINGKILTVEEVQERTAAFFAAYPDFQAQVTPDRVTAINVENFLRAAIVDTIAEDFDIEPTQAQLDQFVEDFGGIEEVTRAVGNAGVPPDPVLVAVEIRSAWIQNRVRELMNEEIDDPEEAEIATRDVLDEFSAAADISVNPRFGTWNGSVVTPTNASLSVPWGDTLTGAEPGS